MSSPRANFTALLRDALGRVVPGSIRRGHNVMTDAGRDILTQLIVWSAFGSPDVAYTAKRARWIGVGAGTQPETRSVVRLADPLICTFAPPPPSAYLKVVSHASNVFPTSTSVSLKVVFGPTEITRVDPAVVVSEAGLFFDANPPGYVNKALSNNVPAFYKTFEPLVKLDSFSMEILWELRF